MDMELLMKLNNCLFTVVETAPLPSRRLERQLPNCDGNLAALFTLTSYLLGYSELFIIVYIQLLAAGWCYS